MAIHREVTFAASDAGVRLSGTLTSPHGMQRGAVLLLAGSGPQDRDESLGGHRPFEVLRRCIPRDAGYAAFSWDDRGVGSSSGDYRAASSDALVADVVCAMDALGPSKAPFVLIGHSQGAHIAARVAVGDPRVRAAAFLGASGRDGRTTLLDQHRRICRADGLDPGLSRLLEFLKSECFEALSQWAEVLSASDEVQLAGEIAKIVRAHLDLSPEEVNEVVDDLLEWEWRFLLNHDPAAWFARVPCPALVLAGEDDCHIDPIRDTQLISTALQEGACPAVAVHVVPGANHLFQTAGRGGTAEYATLGTPFDTASRRIVCTWIRKLRI